jgi:leucyl-tRNA synthetase
MAEEQNTQEKKIDFNAISKKWQAKWEEASVFKVKENPKKNKFYNLEMYPYPSASSMHMGHVRNYTIGDVYARFKRMSGFNVLYPMGYDAFGLPAENAAIKNNIHPLEYTESAINAIKKQQKELGLSYDWSRELASCYPYYYRWNQWFFLKFMEKGLAYRKKAPINWCPKCTTVLANEQVEDGKCWRCDSEVEIKPLEQWFFKITDYADRLLDDLKLLEGKWSEKIISMQRNWIGRSEGTEIQFKIEATGDIIPIFTTRIDTIYGVTFMVFAPEHPKVTELVKGTEYEAPVREFIKKVVLEDKFSRTSEDKEKEGMFIGKYAINPVTGDRVPIYIGNFVLLEYGAGAVMAVPAHDQRDFEFAKKFNIPIKVVINPEDYDLNAEKMARAFIDDGRLVNSSQFDNMKNRDAISEIQKYLEQKGIGKKTVQFKIRDWLISRQRYWGTPIPVVYCEKCGMVPVDEKDLPVELPTDVKFTGEGSPLKTSEKFMKAKCPKCGSHAVRETDTMDGFMDSCWYFLRYTSPKSKKEPFDKDNVNYWMPVDQYIGGAEHAVMHLLYARFFVKVLKDIGLVNFDEPFTRLFNQGIVYKDGAKMSKSKGNIVTQEEISSKYGIDTARLFLMFIAAPDKLIEWADEGIEGSYRFLNRVYALLDKPITTDKDKLIFSKMHRTIKEVTAQIDAFEYNKAIINIMAFANHLQSQEKVPKEALETLVLLLSPFTPHIAEEMWEKLGNKDFIAKEKWPVFKEKFIDESIEFKETFVSKVKEDIRAVLALIKVEKPNKITLFVSEEWKYSFAGKMKEVLAKTHNIGEIMKEVMDGKHNSEIGALVPRLVKDQSKLPEIILSQKDEFNALEESINSLKAAFNCELEIVKAEKSTHQKAKQAMPGKPSIVIE